MKQIHAYNLDLTKIEGEGDCTCPTRARPQCLLTTAAKNLHHYETAFSDHRLEELVIQ
jgi:exonuclease I